MYTYTIGQTWSGPVKVGSRLFINTFMTAVIKSSVDGLYTVLYCNVLYSTVLYCTVLYRTIMYRTVLYYNKKVRNFQIRLRLVHRYSFSQRFYEPQQPYTAQKI